MFCEEELELRKSFVLYKISTLVSSHEFLYPKVPENHSQKSINREIISVVSLISDECTKLFPSPEK